MDDIAENGYAAHWKYKEGNSRGDSSTWLSDMKKALQSNIEGEINSDIKNSLYNHDLFVFTPKDEIKQLRYGATVLDFAFSIHERIGLSCTGAKVNGQHSPIKTELKNGDRVEITTSKSQKPTDEWLTIVKSPAAKQKIRRALKELEFTSLSEGKLLLRKKLESLDINFSQQNIEKLVKHFKLTDQNRLFELAGRQELNLLSNRIKAIFREEPKPAVNEEIQKKSRPIVRHELDTLIIDDGNIQVDIAFAKCCNAVKGDDIFGFVTVNKGVKVHKKSCPNAKDLIENHPHRIVPTAWEK
jgi:GTP pyrophosphokinase